VLPILFFDYVGVEDLRVVNDYGHRGWTGCALRYSLTTREGRLLRRGERPFDLPPDATVKVLTRRDLGDVFGQPDGFRAELTVLDRAGEVLSKNHYDLTAEEIEAFVTSVYPVPPVEPYRSLVVKAGDATESRGVGRRVDAEGTYGRTLLELGGEGPPPYLRYAVNLPQAGDYLVRVAGNSGATLRAFDLLVDGQKAELENYPYTDMTLGMTRLPYSAYSLSWYPGWSVHLTAGRHDLEFQWTQEAPAPSCLMDAIGLQRRL
jgi:hypothetical protein